MPSFYERHVRVDADALERYADALAGSDLSAPDWRLPIYPEGNREFVRFVTVANALNYAFTDFATQAKYVVELDGVAWSGATAMMAALMRARREGVDVLDPETLAWLSLDDVVEIFRPAEGSPQIPMMERRAMMLNAMGADLATATAGERGALEQLAWAVRYDAGELVRQIVSRFSAYADDRWLHPATKERLIFDKRARLLVVMYEGRARASGGELVPLSNLEGIGPVADYQLPRVLRASGVLVYDVELAATVDHGRILPAGSIEELSIRQATCVAVEELLARLNKHTGQPVTMVELDYVLWAAGRKAPGEHHLTPTTAY